MNKSIKYLFFGVVFTLTIYPSLGFSEIDVIEYNKKYGLINKESKIYVIKPVYDYIKKVYYDIGKFNYMIWLDKKCGLMDNKGNIMIKPEYDSCGEPTDGAMAVYRGKKGGFVDYSGNIIIPLEYDKFGHPSSNFGSNAGFRADTLIAEKGRWGVINRNNKTIVPFKYKMIEYVFKSTKPPYDKFLYKLTLENGRSYEIDTSGKKISVEPILENKNEILLKEKHGSKYGFVNEYGAIVIESIYDDAWDFKEGYARVKINSKWGYIDYSGKMVVDAAYDYAWDINEGKAKTRNGDDIIFIDINTTNKSNYNANDLIGTVMNFSDYDGYGFINSEKGNIFIHYSDINTTNNIDQTLSAGEKVQYSITVTKGGTRAKNVYRIK